MNTTVTNPVHRHTGTGFSVCRFCSGAYTTHGLPRHWNHCEPRLKHIGYHFVIGTNGALWNGRSVVEAGAHAAGHNQRSLGICLIGTDQFSATQWQMLRVNVCAMVALLARARRDVEAPRGTPDPEQARAMAARLGIRMVGHRDLPAVKKTCPGFSVADWLAAGMQPLPDHVPDHVLEKRDEL